ncbi:hypothetical protein CC1G_03929 [Coprinopsis cinerea okayama7|uniref:F-box domain-containing protein n=1 Tax=Coprinopsis cinerea (strain Okayama-7 / 130 / ATCC MYA-4618 / FGSC 9003) TaxID=240176 RepID=A8N882_COPC7|nr:hypothetical protein CC1G_03929 [Coprinopsis cinerea okayama7\|eukprot:XP_001831038.2 hypothetical protein CC1G_03929 [Coprinopsis cinerea okayama7\
MFPLELFEATVECLAAQGTMDDLHQCALVNKQLTQLCQKQIFHTVKLVQKEAGWIPPEERVGLPPHPIERFAKVVQQKLAIGDYVRVLEIESMLNYSVDDGFTVLGHLHQVHTFTLAFADGPRHAEHARPWGTISPGLRKNYSEWTCRNNILSRLPSSSLKTLRSITLMLDTWETPEFPVYGKFAHELALIQGENVLEELDLFLVVQIDCDLNLDPVQWQELDHLLSMGFPYLRKLAIRVEMTIFNIPSPLEYAADRQMQLEKILTECFDWSKEHLEFTKSANCWVI